MYQFNMTKSPFLSYLFGAGKDVQGIVYGLCSVGTLARMSHVNHLCRISVQEYLRLRLRQFLNPFIPQSQCYFSRKCSCEH